MIRGSIGSGPPIQPVDARRKSSNHSCARCDLLGLDSNDLGRWPGGVVGTVDREPCSLAVVVTAVCLTTQIAVDEDLQQRRIVVDRGVVHPLCEHRPQLRGVQRGDHGELQFTRGHDAIGFVRRDAPLLGDRRNERRVHLERRADRRKVAVGVGITRLRELLERPVETRGLFGIEFGEVVDRLDRSVEHQRSDPVGEQLGVGGTESGAVREPDVAQSIVADRVADLVEIACRVVRSEPRPDLDRVGGARRGLPLGLGDEGVPTGIVALVEQRDVVVEGVVALDGRARSDATRVERHEVEPSRDLLGHDQRHRLQEVDARRSRPTRIEHQRTDPLVVVHGRHPGDGDVDQAAVRSVVVERHGDRSALDVDGRRLGVDARPPLDRAGSGLDRYGRVGLDHRDLVGLQGRDPRRRGARDHDERGNCNRHDRTSTHDPKLSVPPRRTASGRTSSSR